MSYSYKLLTSTVETVQMFVTEMKWIKLSGIALSRY